MLYEFEAYDVWDNPQLRKVYDVQSSFFVEDEKYVLGVWVKAVDDQNKVYPFYLTAEQKSNLKEIK